MKINFDYSLEELGFLSRHDSDGFNRWEAGQRLSIALIGALESGTSDKQLEEAKEAFKTMMRHHLAAAQRVNDDAVDGASVAYNLALPGLAFLGELRGEVNVDTLVAARKAAKTIVADDLHEELVGAVAAARSDGPFEMTPSAVGRRAIVTICLDYLLASSHDSAVSFAEDIYRSADNMTLWAGALRSVVGSELPSAAAARDWMLADFYTKGEKDALVMDLWFSIQAAGASSDAVDRVKALMSHSDYTLEVPNRMRSVLGAFAGQNMAGFHAASGDGYALLADTVIKLDQFNPQMAARMLGPLTRWRKFDSSRQALMRGALERIQSQDALSADVFEVVNKSLDVPSTEA